MKEVIVRCSHCGRETRINDFRYENVCPTCSNVLPPLNPDYVPISSAPRIQDDVVNEGGIFDDEDIPNNAENDSNLEDTKGIIHNSGDKVVEVELTEARTVDDKEDALTVSATDGAADPTNSDNDETEEDNEEGEGLEL